MDARYLGFDGSADDLSTYTFEAMPLGAGSWGRTIIVMGAARSTGGCTSVEVTVAGVPATLLAATYYTGTGTVTFVAAAHVPTGHEGDITVALGDAHLRCSVAAYSTPAPVELIDQAVDDLPDRVGSAEPQSATVAVVEGGIVLGHAYAATGTTWTWDGRLDDGEDFDEHYDTYGCVSGAHATMPHTGHATVYASTRAVFVARYLLAVSLRPVPTIEVTDRDWAPWQAAVTAPQRVLSGRAELVDPDGVTIVTDLPVQSAEVSYDGDQPEPWAARVVLTDPVWVPDSSRHPLDPRASLRLRLWWRVRAVDLPAGVDVWLEWLVCTVLLVDPDIDDDGLLSMSLTGRDVLAAPRASGYGRAVVDVSGLTVTEAVQALFHTVAPTLPRRLRCATGSVTLPDAYALGLRRPGQDWTEIAGLEGWTVRTDRHGAIECGPIPVSAGVVVDWQEGPDNRVTHLGRRIRNSDLVNSVTVTGTHPDLEEPVVATVEDTDPGSRTYIGGPFGVRNYSEESDAVATEEAAENLARTIYDRLRRPYEVVTLQVPARPDLTLGDRAAVARAQAGAAGIYQVAGWALSMPTPTSLDADMQVRMIERAGT